METGCDRSQDFTLTATDGCGNSSTCVVTYTWVEDVTGPVISGCPVSAIDLGADALAEGVTADDACDGPITPTCSAGTVVETGCDRSQDFTLTATDGCGNSSTCVVTYTWKVDTTDPVITGYPADQEIYADENCEGTIPDLTDDVVATDTCTPAANLVVTQDPLPGTTVGLGPTDVTLTVTDGCGNDSTCTVTLTVVGEPISFNITGNCWQMITVPYNLVSTDPWVVFDELHNGTDLLSGALHRYNGSGYETYIKDILEFDLVPGEGYWLWAFSNDTIQYEACGPTAPAPIVVDYGSAGWHMMGYPKDIGQMDVASVIFRYDAMDYTFAEVAYSWISDPMYGYRASIVGYETVGIEPWDMNDKIYGFRGYWLYTYLDNVSLVAP
ncbi:hypothetical protein AMK68_02220 [candidate division KD3-62 bacterium DG_56]|uniref:HYR domain-containing protein n=1 Tax=candidate division KD3-62 bacterium DG_56 TaxID=1704032 RepID=A0A0S7XNV2_9BACT|nr:MAG: hypothetical protein AMK68_02220 [candidate division KD3-62 bacterium DG_56]